MLLRRHGSSASWSNVSQMPKLVLRSLLVPALGFEKESAGFCQHA